MPEGVPTDGHSPPPEHHPVSGRHLLSRLATHTHSLTLKRAKPSSTRPAKPSKKQLESRERREVMRMKLKEMKAAAANNKRAGIRETDSTEHVSV